MCEKNKTEISIENEDFAEIRCPPQLQQYINLANLIPASFVFPMKLNVYRYASDNFRKSDDIDLPTNESIILAYKHFLKYLPESLFNYIFFSDHLIEIEKRYSLVSCLDNGLISLVYAELEAYEDSESTINEQMLAIAENVPGHVSFQECFIEVDRFGCLRPKINEFFEFISNNDIAADRIRLCANCKKIFWVVNKKYRVCSNQCAGILIGNNLPENDIDNLKKDRDIICSYLQSIKKNLH